MPHFRKAASWAATYAGGRASSNSEAAGPELIQLKGDRNSRDDA